MAFSIRDELRNKRQKVTKEELLRRQQARMVAANVMEAVIIPEFRSMAEKEPDNNFLNLSFHLVDGERWMLQRGCESSEKWMDLNYSTDLMLGIFSIATSYDIQVSQFPQEEDVTYVSFWLDLR